MQKQRPPKERTRNTFFKQKDDKIPIKTPELIKRDYDDFKYWQESLKKLGLDVRSWSKRDNAVGVDKDKIQYFYTHETLKEAIDKLNN